MSLTLRSPFLVGETGFEPATSCSQSRRATRLRHSPNVRWDYRQVRTLDQSEGWFWLFSFRSWNASARRDGLRHCSPGGHPHRPVRQGLVDTSFDSCCYVAGVRLLFYVIKITKHRYVCFITDKHPSNLLYCDAVNKYVIFITFALLGGEIAAERRRFRKKK